MFRFLVLILLSFNILPLFSQDWNSVKNNSAYLYGEGWGTTLGEADKNAIEDLISKISVSVTATTQLEEKNDSRNEKWNTSSNFNSVIHTYSNATLNNSERVILENEPDAHVGRWIRRAEIKKIFEARQLKALEYVESAQKALLQRKIDVALKDYYWAGLLVQSLQYPTDVRYKDEAGEEHVLQTWLPHQIDAVLDALDVKIQKEEGEHVELLFSYQGEPVSSIDYTFFDGADWSNIYSAKDGVGVLELAPGYTTNKYSVKIEYEYRGEAHIDKDIKEVLKVTEKEVRRNAYLKVRKHVAASDHERQEETEVVATEMLLTATQAAPYQQTLERVVRSIVSQQWGEGIRASFTPEGYAVYEGLFKYGRSRIVGDPHLCIYATGDKTVAKGLQMTFSFKHGLRKTFTENLVFTFNSEGLIENITFGLSDLAEKDILGKGRWPMNVRLALMQFLENYQTAYALKRLDYIETIFDDDAVIITGKVAQRMDQVTSDRDGVSWKDNAIVTYNRYDKHSFLKQLKRSFDSKEYINLRLADNEIRKLGLPGEFYSIQIAQEYYSSNYGDKGYLFLMVDMNKPDQPIIKVRTWQPEKDPKFGIYGPEDFQ